MPAKAKITKEMILDAAFDNMRREEAEKLNARMIAKRLKCSTQPILHRFERMEEIRKEIYTRACVFHMQYLIDHAKEQKSQVTAMGLASVGFAAEEPYLFKFIFQSGSFSRKGMLRFGEKGEPG